MIEQEKKSSVFAKNVSHENSTDLCAASPEVKIFNK